jgi:hypothetical protein
MVYLTGKLDKDSDYTNAEGELVRGGLMVRCDMIDNWAANSEASTSAAAPAKAAGKPAKPGKAAPAKPAAKKPAPPKPAVAK